MSGIQGLHLASYRLHASCSDPAQVTASPATRTYLDFATKTKALEGLLRLFEEDLKKRRATPTITYDISELYKYLDNLGDVSCLV